MISMKEAMQTRHTVRKYTDKSLPEGVNILLKTRMDSHNETYQLALSLKTGDDRAISSVIKLLMAKNVRNYFVLAGPDTVQLDEKLGYCGADLMLYAQTLGLNTWWIGGTYNHRQRRKEAGTNRVIGILVVGYGENQGTLHKSKLYDEIATYEGEAPEWYREGVKAVLLAPTALNKQAFQIQGIGNRVKITCHNGNWAGVDLGIAKYHFELGAGKKNFSWDA